MAKNNLSLMLIAGGAILGGLYLLSKRGKVIQSAVAPGAIHVQNPNNAPLKNTTITVVTPSLPNVPASSDMITVQVPTSFQHSGETDATFQSIVQVAANTAAANNSVIPAREPPGTPVGQDYTQYWPFTPQFDGSGALMGFVAT